MTTAHQSAGTHLTYNRFATASVPPGSTPPSRKKPILFEVGQTYKNRAGETRTLERSFTEDWAEYTRGWRFVDEHGVCYKDDGRAHPKGEPTFEDLVLQ